VLGFTLIELLVVIAILAIIGSLVAFRLVNGTAKARDGIRKANLGQIASALEQYYTDNGFRYIPGNYTSESVDNWIPNLNPYFKSIPKDPKQAFSFTNFMANVWSAIGDVKVPVPSEVYAAGPGYPDTYSGPSCVDYGTSYTLTSTFEHPGGGGDFRYAYIYVNTNPDPDWDASPKGAFTAVLNVGASSYAVRDFAGSSWDWSGNPNPYATLNRASSSYSVNGTTLTVNWNITFNSNWENEAANVWLRTVSITDSGDVDSGVIDKGDLQIPCLAPTPTPTMEPTPTATPSGGSGSPVYYYGYYSDPAGTYYELWARLEDSSDPFINTATGAKCKLSVPDGAPIDFNYCVSSHK